MSGNVFQLACTKCRQLTCVMLNKACQNRLLNGKICGQPLEMNYLDGTGYFQKKYSKHTNPRSGFLGTHSHIASGLYPACQARVMADGSIWYDPNYNSLVLTSPVQSGAIANLSSIGGSARGDMILMPLIEPSKLHSYFSVSGQLPLQFIADSPNRIE